MKNLDYIPRSSLKVFTEHRTIQWTHYIDDLYHTHHSIMQLYTEDMVKFSSLVAIYFSELN